MKVVPNDNFKFGGERVNQITEFSEVPTDIVRTFLKSIRLVLHKAVSIFKMHDYSTECKWIEKMTATEPQPNRTVLK